MSASIPTREPDAFTAGDTVQWLKSLPDYDPADYNLAYAFVSIVGQFAATGVDNGEGEWLVTLAAADTVGILESTYWWTAAVTDIADTQRFTVGNGQTRVLPDLLASPAARETRPYPQRLLDALEAAIEGRATTDQASYSIGGVSVSKLTLEEMLNARDRVRAEVIRDERRDRVARGLGNSGNVLVRL